MSKILTSYLGDDLGFSNGVTYSPAIPAVIFQSRMGGEAIRVEREGKGDHLTLVRDGRVLRIVMPGRGVVGILGWSGHTDSYCVEAYGPLDFSQPGNRQRGEFIAEADNLADAIGEAGLFWLS